MSNKLLTDGEIFFLVFKGKNNEVVLRYIDPLQIVDIATDPEDDTAPRFYKRVKKIRGKTNANINETEEIIYADWANNPSDGKLEKGEWFDGELVTAPSGKDIGTIFHVKLESGNLRSYPLIVAQMKWTQSYRDFMRSRISIQQGLARIIRNIKTKGGKKYIDKLKARLQSSKVGSGDPETNPQPAYGATQIGNDLTDTTTTKQETGATAAKIDGAMLISMAGAAVGIFSHYFGFGESFRLATATAMETPMLKRFEAYRKLWIDTYSAIFNFVLNVNKIDISKISYDISYPDIFPKAMKDKVEALAKTAETFPALKESEEFLAIALGELGIPDAQIIIDGLDMSKNLPELNSTNTDHNDDDNDDDDETNGDDDDV